MSGLMSGFSSGALGPRAGPAASGAPGHEQLQRDHLTLVHGEAHEDEAVHRLSAIGVHMLAIVKEKLINPETQT